MEKIYLVEDNESFGEVLKSYLELNNFEVTLVRDGKDAVKLFKQKYYDICIFDVMLPNFDGFTIAKEIKKIEKNISFIFLTAKTMKEDMLKGFKIGADDYITKPFDSEVLLFKIRAIINRKNKIDKQKKEEEKINNFVIGEYNFDYRLRTLETKDFFKKLSPKEAQLLKMLCLNKNDILTREEALTQIWEDNNFFTGRSMDVYITKLRKYLQRDANIKIENIHSSGFRLLIKN